MTKECVCPNAFETGGEVRQGLGKWIAFHNCERPASAFDGRSPNEVWVTDPDVETLTAQTQPEPSSIQPRWFLVEYSRDHRLSSG